MQIQKRRNKEVKKVRQIEIKDNVTGIWAPRS